MNKSRIKIERAIYKAPNKEDYYIMSYSKETKKTKNLAHFDNLHDAKIWRDTNLRSAKYGKGIKKLSNGKYSAELTLYSKYKRTNIDAIETFYIGTFNTADEAREARKNLILNLL